MMKKAYSSRRLFVNLAIAAAGVIYVLIMFNLLFVRHRYFGSGGGYGYSYNLTPFKTIIAYINDYREYNSTIAFKNLAGNIVLFIPIGVIFPLLFKPLLRFIRFTVFTAVLIILVELSQMLLRVGSFDIDDVILNTFGAVIGLGMTKLLLVVLRRKSSSLMA